VFVIFTFFYSPSTLSFFSLSLFCVQGLQFCVQGLQFSYSCFTDSYIGLLYTNSYVPLLCSSYSCFTDGYIGLLCFSRSSSVMLCLPSPRPSLFKALIKFKPSVNSYVVETHTLAKCASLIRVQVHIFLLLFCFVLTKKVCFTSENFNASKGLYDGNLL